MVNFNKNLTEEMSLLKEKFAKTTFDREFQEAWEIDLLRTLDIEELSKEDS